MQTLNKNWEKGINALYLMSIRPRRNIYEVKQCMRGPARQFETLDM